MVDLSALRAELSRTGRLSLTVKVIPKSSRNEIVGVLEDGALKLKITAAPEKGKANGMVCDLLADTFSVPKRAVTITRGETSHMKVIEIRA